MNSFPEIGHLLNKEPVVQERVRDGFYLLSTSLVIGDYRDGFVLVIVTLSKRTNNVD